MKKLTRFSLLMLALCGFTVMNAQVPPTAPPDLPYDAGNVLSFFSEKYGEAFVMDTPPWGSPSTWDYTATGDEQLAIVLRDLNWISLRLNGSAPLKNYQYIHVDVFCNEATQFRVGFSSHYPGDKEQYFPMIEEGTMVPGKWYSIEYNIDDFFLDGWEGSRDAHYLRFGGNIDGEKEWADEIYVTNFVLFNEAPTCIGGVVRDVESGISNPKKDIEFNACIQGNELKCSTVETIKQISICNAIGQATGSFAVSGNNSTINVADFTSGIYIVSAELDNGRKVSKRVIK